jgi:NADH-quinone oxidoreductase subunit G
VPVAGLPTALWNQLGLQKDSRVLVSQGEGAVVMAVREDSTLAAKTIRVAAGHPTTAALGAMFGAITVEKVASA